MASCKSIPDSNNSSKMKNEKSDPNSKNQSHIAKTVSQIKISSKASKIKVTNATCNKTNVINGYNDGNISASLTTAPPPKYREHIKKKHSSPQKGNKKQETDDELDMTADPFYDPTLDDNTQKWFNKRYGDKKNKTQKKLVLY